MAHNQLPLFVPQTEWICPTEYPDLTHYGEIAIDLETKDPHLLTHGPGWSTGDGHIIGIAVAVENKQWYFPIRHENGPNLDPKRTLAWLADVVGYEDKAYIFHNAQYDVGWMLHEGVTVKGKIEDTMVVAPLIDENRWSYSLDALLKTYLSSRKDERLLKEAAASFGVNPKAEMYKLPAAYVGIYGEQDARGTFDLWQHFKQLIIKEDIQNIYELEIAVIPILIKMRKRGVRVDLDKAAVIKKDLRMQEKEILKKIHHQYGVNVEIWAADSISKAFDNAGLSYPRTEKTNAPSFQKEYLGNHAHELPRMIVKARGLNKAHTTFIDSYMEHSHKGRIHTEFHSLRSDKGGTVTGRFSCSNPNLQQVPARDPIMGPLIRGLFIPEEGTVWGCYDYSSQEPRILVHYASLLKLTGAQDFVEKYKEDVTTDFHQMAADIMKLPRKTVKEINLGLFYGMGKKALASNLGLELNEAYDLFDEYHRKVPFVKELSDYTMNRASERGVIRTVLGRKGRFELWEPKKYGIHKPLNYSDTYAEHGALIKRAFTYRALNKLIQGSAADQTKAAMIALDKEGISCMLQVHDELDHSTENEKQGRMIKEIMENCVDLVVPSLVDAEFGDNWGIATKTFADNPWKNI